jgi:hypothetical protein
LVISLLVDRITNNKEERTNNQQPTTKNK